MTTYTRQCDGHPQKCPRSPQCGLDCDFNNADSNPGYTHTLIEQPAPEEEFDWLSLLDWRGFFLALVFVLAAFTVSGGWK